MPHRLCQIARRTLALAPLAGLLVGSLAGCEYERRGGMRAQLVADELAHRVPIHGGPVTFGRLTAIDIDNPNGPVEIDVDPRHEEASIRFDVMDAGGWRAAAKREGQDFDPTAEWFEAEFVRTGETALLRVRPTELAAFDGRRPRISIRVRTPICDGLVIRNANGDVEVIGPRGAIDIESGRPGALGGEIEVRTNQPIDAPVRLVSTDGSVILVGPPESGGIVELTSNTGEITFNSSFGVAEVIRPAAGKWTGVYNSGANPVRLHSDAGDCIFMVVERPELYGVDRLELEW